MYVLGEYILRNKVRMMTNIDMKRIAVIKDGMKAARTADNDVEVFPYRKSQPSDCVLLHR